MGLYCDNKAGDVMLEGTTGCLAVLHHGSDFIEIWDEDGEEFLGKVPATFSAEHINTASNFFHAGVQSGRVLGAQEKQVQIRAALGLS